MISIVVPLPPFSFFFRACLRNIHETIGLRTDQFEVVFLKTEDNHITDDLTLPCRVVTCPFTTTDGIHNKLLDWSVGNAGLQEWVYVQHADMFWMDSGWGEQLIASLDDSYVALATPHDRCKGEFNCVKHKFSRKGKVLTRTHDFSGTYQRRWLQKSTFMYGKADTELTISDNLKSQIQAGEYQWINRKQPLCIGDHVDGADLLGLEIAANGDKIKFAEISCDYIHSWDLFHILYDTSRDYSTGTLIINRRVDQCVRSLHSYSWLSSHLFSLSEHRDQIIPWALVRKLCRVTKIPGHVSTICRFLQRYRQDVDTLGEYNTLGLWKVQFSDQKFNFRGY